MIRCIIGCIALVLFMYTVAFKKLHKIFRKIKSEILVKFHSLVGLVVLILATVHAAMTGHALTLSLGTLSLFLIIFIFITGMIISHIKKRNTQELTYIHIGFSLLTLVCIVLHIIENFI